MSSSTSASSSTSFFSNAWATASSLSRCSASSSWASSSGVVQDPRNFLVDHLSRVLAELALLVDFLAQERMLLAGAEGDRPQPFAHAPMSDHPPGQLGHLGQIVFRPGGILAEDQLFRGPTAERENQPAVQFRIR